MAKTCWLEQKNAKPPAVAKYATLRAELKAKGDYIGLSQLPRNASPVRMSRRCLASGRKRAFISRFKLSRIAFRELASNGMIPGVTKSSHSPGVEFSESRAPCPRLVSFFRQ